MLRRNLGWWDFGPLAISAWHIPTFGLRRDQSSTATNPELDACEPSRLERILQEFLDGVQRPSRPIKGVECHETTSFGTPPWTLGPHPHVCCGSWPGGFLRRAICCKTCTQISFVKPAGCNTWQQQWKSFGAIALKSFLQKTVLFAIHDLPTPEDQKLV